MQFKYNITKKKVFNLQFSVQREYTIQKGLLGYTYSGKSTITTAMVNYSFSLVVTYENACRFIRIHLVKTK